ncbi:hypothetical protein [Enemella evansiae]|uniref:Uncharacterized protein n=1 Tax=Enemella evansiae TaxID=2016499 RepID=A0A255GFN4_9ACTN|nr:hypothetical protein [Enemella evansiae]PFG67849.1 hypothetical protein B0O41_2670 [Propionibacteriaceae bacterium ES.041]OYN93018.1 hypothetical protein CGZ95_20395 [Enemella evansiae]OYN95934.1 hypothetical protein CGZ96_15765 [Enemella evansiae]OYO04149.1 hypothetical protein CGZ97_12330 [Enemella evansiae]OYO06969.1 hypothetical protein CGZ98_20800 [Enemella evansiae]
MRKRSITVGALLAVLVIPLLLAGCAARPSGSLLQSKSSTQVVRQIADAADSKQVLSAKLSSFEASVQVIRDNQAETWTLREGATDPVRSAIAPLDPAARPMRVKDVDLSGPANALAASDISTGCSERGVRLEVDLQLGRPLTHLICLDNSRHIWLGADLRPISDVDLRSADGITTALGELKAITGGGPIGNLALIYDENTRLELEQPGPCGNLVDCPATVVSRAALFGAQPPFAARVGPARLNYAVPIDPATLDPAQLHGSIKQVMNDRKYNWWRQFTVTVYQVRENSPMMEFKVGDEVFYTDLAGRPLPNARS